MSSEPVFANYSQAELDSQYNASGTVPSVDPYFAAYIAASEKTRAELRHEINVKYGPHERERVDLFPATQPDSPLFVFIHGGYWRRMDSSFFSYVAGPVVRAGGAAAIIAYPLAPEASLDQIVESVRTAFAFIAANAARRLNASPHGIVVGGHSAGGQLSGIIAATDWNARGVDASVGGVFGLSGLYDLDPVRRSNVNEWMKLDAEAASRYSPSGHMPARKTPLIAVVGADETDEFRRQTRDFADGWNALGYPAEMLDVPGHNHFSIVLELADASSELTQRLLDTLRLAELKRILFERWDPIGVNSEAPRDEYDRYAVEVWGMLKGGATIDEIEAYLTWAVTEHMALSESRKLNREIAETAMALYERGPAKVQG